MTIRVSPEILALLKPGLVEEVLKEEKQFEITEFWLNYDETTWLVRYSTNRGKTFFKNKFVSKREQAPPVMTAIGMYESMFNVLMSPDDYWHK